LNTWNDSFSCCTCRIEVSWIGKGRFSRNRRTDLWISTTCSKNDILFFYFGSSDRFVGSGGIGIRHVDLLLCWDI